MRDYSFHNVIMLRKENDTNFTFPNKFTFDNYVFILKALVYNDTEKNHFYTCIRSKFSDLFYMLNDRQVKMIDINDIDITPFLALYYVFHDDIIEEMEDDLDENEEELVVPDEIQDALNEICEVCGKCRMRVNKNDESDFNQISPRVQLNFEVPKKKKYHRKQ